MHDKGYKGEKRNRITEMEITWRVISGGVERGESRGKVQVIRGIIVRYKIARGRLRIVWRSQEIICMTHGHG